MRKRSLVVSAIALTLAVGCETVDKTKKGWDGKSGREPDVGLVIPTSRGYSGDVRGKHDADPDWRYSPKSAAVE